VSLFKSWKKKTDVQQFLTRLANQRILQKLQSPDERRSETRTDLCIGVWVIPLADGQPDATKAFPAVTRDFTCRGIGLIARQPLAGLDEVLLAIPEEMEKKLLRVSVYDRVPLGTGWYLLCTEGVRLLDKDEYPSLSPLPQS
jgi:hypothetical protein